jgi:hypothetical protein
LSDRKTGSVCSTHILQVQSGPPEFAAV